MYLTLGYDLDLILEKKYIGKKKENEMRAKNE